MNHQLNFNTDCIRISGGQSVQSVCAQMIAWSQWFSVMPLPDDEWEVAVRPENAERVRNLVSA